MTLLAIAIATSGVVFNQESESKVPPTWNGNVASIIEKSCSRCHSDDGVAPFALATHGEVAERAVFMLQVIDAGLMPPWLPESGHLDFRNERVLSKADRATLGNWVEAGFPVGEGDARPVVVSTEDAFQSDLQRTTMLRHQIPEESDAAYHSGEMDRHGFRVIMRNPLPLRVRGIKGSSSAPQAVRVMTLVGDTEGRARYLDGEDPLPGWRTSTDMGYTPAGSLGCIQVGEDSVTLPEGFHWEYPPRVDISLGLHYRPTGKIETLMETLEFDLVPDDEVSRRVDWLPSTVLKVDVPAGETAVYRDEDLVIPVACDLVAITPRAIEICVGHTIELEYPDGTTKTLLDIRDWDHHQRETYVLESPLVIPAGSRIKSMWTLDNREENPRNPDYPPIDQVRRMRAGTLLDILHVSVIDQTHVEILKGFGEKRIKGLQMKAPQRDVITPSFK